MAEIVAIAGVPHNPFLPKLLNQRDIPQSALATARRFTEFRERLEAAQPDRIVIIGSDHLRQWFLDNMPAFLVGKAASIPGVFPDEIEGYGLEPQLFAGDTDLATAIMGAGQLDVAGIDFSFSNEFGLDHAFVVPLIFLDPEGRLPIVPIFTNGVAPPLPPAERFITLGNHLARTLTSDAVDGRIAVIVSGHLSIEVGGPKMFPGEPYDREFDEQGARWIGSGDIDGLLEACTLDRLLSAGNVTYQYLNFVTAMTLAGYQRPEVADSVLTAGESLPFFWWDGTTSTKEGPR
jgi:aromatic ring-opening dioxygenase catalytic subunit (LigB family)